ncbi:hypothetical protein RHECNPAF_1360047 [Rhizobium etli CNPAF512]|nr:hypothetical protein RHECNPAF_1360047 [Rhizobium etli CNPAF512]
MPAVSGAGSRGSRRRGRARGRVCRLLRPELHPLLSIPISVRPSFSNPPPHLSTDLRDFTADENFFHPSCEVEKSA